jgi:galactokinase
MTGGGFGGCTVNLVQAETVDEFKRTVEKGYFDATGISPKIYICEASNGAGEIV